jgi:hypothetical protein
MRLPFAFAFRIPARTRSRIQSLSNSEKALMIWKSSFPVVVVKSSPSEKLTSSTPMRRNSSNSRTRCSRLRPRRSRWVR